MNRTARKTGLRRRRGFTLAELTIVVLIIGIMAAASVPRMADSLQFFRAKAAAERVQADLKYARATARTTNANETVSFNVSGDQYSLSSAKNLDRSALTYSVDIGGSVYRASIVAAVFGGSSDVTFNAYGIPSSGGQVTVAANDYTFVVDLDAGSGKATIAQQ